MARHSEFPEWFPKVGQKIRIVRQKRGYPLLIEEGVVMTRSITDDCFYVSILDSNFSEIRYREGKWTGRNEFPASAVVLDPLTVSVID